MQANIAVVGAIVSVIAAVVAASAGLWTAGQTRRSQQTEAYRTVHELYDRMIHLKLEHPEFLVCARQWDGERMASVYAQRGTSRMPLGRGTTPSRKSASGSATPFSRLAAEGCCQRKSTRTSGSLW